MVLIHAQNKPKHKLEKWFISGDGVRTSVRTYTYAQNKTNRSQSEITFQASALVGAWAWIITTQALLQIVIFWYWIETLNIFYQPGQG